jgi:hypothetical protein
MTDHKRNVDFTEHLAMAYVSKMITNILKEMAWTFGKNV